MNRIAAAIRQKAVLPLINIGSGILLKIVKPFKKGDFIEINGQLGSVSKKGLKQTLITNLDGSISTIENGKFYSGNLHNLTTKNIIRLSLSVNLCYTSDMARAKESITHFLNQTPKILQNPAPKLQVVRLKEKCVEINVQPWCLLDDFMELDQELQLELTQHLTAQGFPLKLEELDFENLGVSA